MRRGRLLSRLAAAADSPSGALLAVVLTGALCVACGEPEAPVASETTPSPKPSAPVAVAYVGAETCAECHAEESERWRGSHHDRAMEPAAAALAPFAGETFEHAGVPTRFDREGEALVVETQGADGATGRFPVAYTFGVEPLQQLLLPTEGGRLQALRVAWDSRPEEAGGGRWFQLQPGEPGPPGDVMHWTGVAHNWNSQCVDCHSTAVRRGFDVAEQRFETTWQELDVACEACHGPSARHVAAAREGRGAEVGPPLALADERRWVLAEGDSIAHRVPDQASDQALEVCAPCHSRRSPLTATTQPSRPFLDGYHPALLEDGLYHADGQIDDEVYVWGSFVQSRMYRAGVRCGDCHDPHALAIEEPDLACRSCHRSEVFASPEHHHHEPEGEGASCVACHMPASTYMEIDSRRDHSFRVPRPDLAETLGTPDACTGCHADRDASWARQAAETWWPGLTERGQFADALHAGRLRTPDAPARLLALLGDDSQPAIARATALRLLGTIPSQEVIEAVQRGARSREPLIRLAAVSATRSLPPELRAAVLPPLLDDHRAIRIEAARELVIAADQLDERTRRRQEQVLNEWIGSRRANAEQPASHVALANLHRARGDVDAAREALSTAVRIGPWFIPASVGLADLQRELGEESQAVATLSRALERAPESPELHHALGLAQVRGGDLEAAVASLTRAAELAPHEPRFVWVLAVAFRDGDEPERAKALLRDAARLHPNERTLLSTLVEWAMEDGDAELAGEAARALLARDPDDSLGRAVLRALPEADAS
ncbi:MAG: tetratricopeptide repeat protein [Myxococcota bacterium]|nr:tetratricopeptide repeat protein [Myxococcota bacterium]